MIGSENEVGPTDQYIAGIEVGGTTWVLAIARDDVELCPVARMEIPTTTPEETISKAKVWLHQMFSQFPFRAIGIASFGPLDLQRSSPTYGCITHSPKEHWQQVNLVQIFSSEFHLPIGFETDVNAPAVYEHQKVSADLPNYKSSNLCYITIGTGIGVGISCGGLALHGTGHPEAGHMLVALHPQDLEQKFTGTCVFHGSCLEGLAASGAIAQRLGIARRDLHTVRDDHKIWDIVAFYLAQCCMNLTLTVAPACIVLGGGLMKRHVLLRKIQTQFQTLVASYVRLPTDIESYIRRSRVSTEIGLTSALFLAQGATWWGATPVAE